MYGFWGGSYIILHQNKKGRLIISELTNNWSAFLLFRGWFYFSLLFCYLYASAAEASFEHIKWAKGCNHFVYFMAKSLYGGGQ